MTLLYITLILGISAGYREKRYHNRIIDSHLS